MDIQYSQNFLKSKKIVEHLIKKSSINLKDIVYEIGPGRGVITQELAKRCKKVIAIEKDKQLFNYLRGRFKNNSKIEIKYGDFLHYPLPKEECYKVFSNIPFNITAEIIHKLTSAKNPSEDIYLFVQKEAAKKFIGFPYAKKTQMEALFLKPWFDLKVLYHFKRTDFEPLPRVDIVFLRIKKRQQPLINKNQSQDYRDFIVYGFSQWKPTLREGFKKIFTKTQFKKLSKDLKIPYNVTPAQLNFDQWYKLFQYFLIGVSENKKKKIFGAENILKNQQKNLQKIHRTRK